MEDFAGPTIEDLLRRFVSAGDDESDHALAVLYTVGIEPAASAVIRQKLRVSLRLDNEDALNQTGLDLLSDVKTRLLPMLRRLRSAAEPDSVENFGAYVKAAALNAYRQFLRDKYPVRLRLRNKIRYIITRGPAYSTWKDESGETICGRSEWSAGPAARLQAGAVDEIKSGLEPSGAGSAQPDDNRRIIQALESVFVMAGAPLAFEDLVSIVWAALGLREMQKLSDSDAALDLAQSKEPDIEQRLDDHGALERLWEQICVMPLRHRRALLLNLHDDRGENLLAIFPTLGIASIRQIAQALEYEAKDLAALWNHLPLDDNSIAEKMGLTRQQVINLRQSARASLRRSSV